MRKQFKRRNYRDIRATYYGREQMYMRIGGPRIGKRKEQLVEGSRRESGGSRRKIKLTVKLLAK